MSFSFQLGRVKSVFTSNSDTKPLESTPAQTGRILFNPINDENPSSKSLSAIPLFRGYNDSIQHGDLILYAVITKRIYYLGPLNTQNNPSKTIDPAYNPRRGGLNQNEDLSKDNADGTNKLIPNFSVPKLAKIANNKMDFPAISDRIDYNSILYSESTFSDLVLEGRYGNAIRIGARNLNPTLIISNNNKSESETLGGGGSIFAMTSIGTIDNNFPSEIHKEKRNNELIDVPGYRLSADSDGFNINRGNDIVNEEIPESRFNYNYGFIKDYIPDESINPNNEFDQIIISSDRLIFNSTVEDVTISANRNINLGSNKNFTLNNKGFSVFQSQNIYIGEEAKKRDEPMVLGNKLQNLLVRILRLLGDAQALGDMNVPQKLTLFPNIHVAGTLSQEVDNIMQEFNLGTIQPGQNPVPEFEKNLDENGNAVSDSITGQASFLSNRHFVEPNRVEVEVQGPPAPLENQAPT